MIIISSVERPENKDHKIGITNESGLLFVSLCYLPEQQHESVNKGLKVVVPRNLGSWTHFYVPEDLFPCLIVIFNLTSGHESRPNVRWLS